MFSTLFRKIIWLVCYILATFQSSQILVSIVRKPHTIITVITNPNNFKLPALSICTPTALYEARFHRLSYELYPPRLALSNRKYNVSVIDHYRDSQINNLIEQCSVLAPNLTAVDCFDLTKTKFFVNKQHICHTLFFENSTSTIADYELQDIANFVLFEIRLNTAFAKDKDITVVVHGNKLLPLPYFVSYGSLVVNSLENDAMYMFYDEVRIRHLNQPIGTCMDYSTIGFSSASHCHDMCLAKRSISRTGNWPAEIFYDIEDIGQDMNLSLVHLTDGDTIECQAECPILDCNYSRYTTTLRKLVTVYKGNDSARLVAQKDRVSINIAMPVIREMVIEYHDRVIFNNILSQFAGMFSLWIGLSLMVVFKDLIGLCDRVDWARIFANHR